MRCYHCKDEITDENKTKEHIIPDSLGGKLTSTSILCIDCNSILGSKIDVGLFEQLKFASVYLGLSKNNSITLQTLAGEEMVAGKGLVPYFKSILLVPNSDKKPVSWRQERKDALRVVEKSKKNINNKYPDLKIDFKEYENQNKGKIFYLIQENARKAGEIFFGGERYFRAIVKIAIGFAYSKNVHIDYLEDAISFLKGGKRNDIGFFYPTSYSVREELKNDIAHLLFLKGDKANRVLYVYSELFAFCNHIVVLSKNYGGEDIEFLYHFDLMKKQIIPTSQINIRLTKTHFEDIEKVIVSMHQNNEKEQKRKFDLVLSIFEAMQLSLN